MLSVCCPTGDPGPRIATALAPLRDVADEIVVAADSRVSDADLAEYGAVADRLLKAEFSYFERHLAWLHFECRGDWVLGIDGDEVMSPALLDQLPELMRAGDAHGGRSSTCAQSP